MEKKQVIQQWVVCSSSFGEYCACARAHTHTHTLLSRFSCVWLFATLWTVTCQPPLSVEFSRQEYRSVLPFPLPGIFLTQGLNPCLLWLLHCKQILYHWATREAHSTSLSDINWSYPMTERHKMILTSAILIMSRAISEKRSNRDGNTPREFHNIMEIIYTE